MNALGLAHDLVLVLVDTQRWPMQKCTRGHSVECIVYIERTPMTKCM